MGMFYLKRLIGNIIQPAPLTMALLLMAFLLIWSGGSFRRRIGLVALAAAFVLFAATVFPHPVRGLARQLESNYQPIPGKSNQPVNPGLIVVHGGGVDHPDDQDFPALTRLNDTSRARLVEGVRLALLFPDAKLVVTGNGLGLENCADAMGEAAVELGIAADRVVRLSDTLDTRREAEGALRLANNNEVLVVTTAVHMERAMRIYESLAAKATAAPCDFIAPADDHAYETVTRHRWRPSGTWMRANEKTWHELMGLLHMELAGDDR